MLKINGSVAVITGGASGIGKSLATYWVQQGGAVAIGDLSDDGLTRVKAEIEAMGGRVAVLKCDVKSESDNAALAELAIDRFGAINLVAPCAGIIKDGLFLNVSRETGKVIHKMPLDQFQSVVDINLTGVFLTIRECGERMINNNCSGLICLFSSVGSLGTAGQINYSSTKAAMSTIPKVISAEFFRRGLSPRIRCVAVAPGFVATEMVRNMNQRALERIMEKIPIQRLIEPEEVASLVGELFRNEAITGDVYYIHGGLRIGSRG